MPPDLTLTCSIHPEHTVQVFDCDEPDTVGILVHEEPEAAMARLSRENVTILRDWLTAWLTGELPVPPDFDPVVAQQVLDGHDDRLYKAFEFLTAKPSHAFWQKEYYSPALSAEARTILTNWLAKEPTP